MYLILFAFFLCAVVGQQGHDLSANLHHLFDRYDHSPKDGIITEAELEQLLTEDDVNNDTCVTLKEYTDANQGLTEHVAHGLYGHYDHNNDGCLDVSDVMVVYHDIDENGDNQVNLHEWQQYFTKVFTNLFGQVG